MNTKSARGRLWLIALLAITIFAITLLVPKSAAQSIVTPVKESIVASSTPVSVPEKVVPKIAPVPKILSDIGWCESKNDQTRVGYNYRYKTVTDAQGVTSTVKVLWSKDIGKYQINDYCHEARATSLGLDIHTEAGNTAYALLLYNKNGTRDWNPSKACWQDVEAWKAKHQSYY